MSNASYKFEEHLIKKSRSKDFKNAVEEWVFIKNDEQTPGTIPCICSNNNIKYIYYFFNIINGNMVSVGKNCAKRLGFNVGTGSGKIHPCLKSFLSDYMAIYTNIDDLLNGSEIKMHFIEFVKKNISGPNVNEAYLFVKGLLDFFKKYNHNFPEIQLICDELKTKIDIKEAEVLEQRLAKEKKIQDEKERIRVEQEKIWAEQMKIEEERRIVQEGLRLAEEKRVHIQRLISEQQRIQSLKDIQIETERLVEEARERDRIERANAEEKNIRETQRRKEVAEKARKIHVRMSILSEIREYGKNRKS